MKLLFRSSLFACVIFASVCARAGYLEELEKGPLPQMKPPYVFLAMIKNGINFFLFEDHTLPMVKVEVITKAGGIYDPADKIGLAELTGMLMRSGGAGGRTPEEFDAAVDDLGAGISSEIGREMGVAGLEVLAEDLEKGLKLFFDMLFKPSFDLKRMNVAKSKIEESLRREDDEPRSLAARHFGQFVYGASNVWARRPSKATLARITREDAREFHKNYFKTGNILIAASGDFNANDFISLITRLTLDAPEGKADFPDVPEVKLGFEPGAEQITRPTTQSFIRMGHLGIKRDNPDKFALIVMNDILGGGSFKSRLMEDIRTRRGMAYSIRSSITPMKDYGLFVVGVDTKSKQAAKVIELVRAHLKRFAKGDDVTPEELEFAKKSILSSLIFDFDNASKIVDRRATYFFYGYPDNYWQIMRNAFSNVKRDDVRDVARKYLHPEGLKIVVVGPKVEGLK